MANEQSAGEALEKAKKNSKLRISQSAVIFGQELLLEIGVRQWRSVGAITTKQTNTVTRSLRLFTDD